jgi:transcriptional regulator with XRE-family HTH domain
MSDLNERSMLSQNLIKLRKKHGLTQEDLSSRSGVSRRTIALYETKAAKPPLKNIEKIAAALHVKIEDLTGKMTVRNSSKMDVDFTTVDSRTLKKFKQILDLPPEQRHMIYSMVDSLSKKNSSKAS